MKDILKAVKSGRITKRKPAKKLRLSTEEKDKLQVLAEGLSLRTGSVKITLSEKVNACHDAAIAKLGTLGPEHFKAMGEFQAEVEKSSTPFSMRDLERLKDELDDLTRYSEKYFEEREALMSELEEVISDLLSYDATETIDSVGESLFKDMEDAVTQSKRALQKAMKECDAFREKENKAFALEWGF